MLRFLKTKPTLVAITTGAMVVAKDVRDVMADSDGIETTSQDLPNANAILEENLLIANHAGVIMAKKRRLLPDVHADRRALLMLRVRVVQGKADVNFSIIVQRLQKIFTSFFTLAEQ